ncbi:hypothetical protein PVAND_017031 [Polypedilum vanderplanki]|uniref:K Homology domain-containing protein n=1 Tax=Polypedilum vanderplanki TaxID=319348 RepID=A0A9J6BHU3_POLVA|nr:hypothetical protein PVAND_017031 [Polypedilum vanderplanki]
MASNVDQFADLELSKEDREQIFDDPNEGAESHTPQNGSRAANGLNGTDFEGSKLSTELLFENKSQSSGGGASSQKKNQKSRTTYGNVSGGPGRQTDFPLRVLVASDMVGAIIGRQGSTIRQITQQQLLFMAILKIARWPVRGILEVMQQEANNTKKGEICLKILAHNNLIGRIIGKSGNTIKRIMQDTDTKITVSSINDINSFNLERIITIKGSIENMSRGEAQISSKLRQSYENDLQALAPQSIMFPGLHPMAMMSTSGNGLGFPGRPGNIFPSSSNYPPMYQPTGTPAVPGAADVQETTYLYIPNNAVGAIIGTKGSHIRNIIRFSGANVKIAPLEADKPQEQQTERKVTIVGTPEAQWKAQYLIYEKMREEGFVSGTDDVRLTVEILVPSSQVGRIIGKGGQNVRELQRVTGSIIKLPEHTTTASSTADEETTVHIIGPFFSVQSAQRRIRTMIIVTNPPPASGRPKPSSSGNQTPQQQPAPSTPKSQNQSNAA